jgi:hypothetical protein
MVFSNVPFVTTEVAAILFAIFLSSPFPKQEVRAIG